MSTTEPNTFRHRQVTIGKSSLHVVEAGDPDATRCCSCTAGRSPGAPGSRS